MYHNNRIYDQNGSMSLLMIMFVSMAMLLMVGILSVMEWNSSVTKARTQTQSAANAGAFAYGHTYITEMKICVTEEISEQLEEEGDEKFELCRLDGLPECVESEFETCDLDLKSCWEDGESPMETCAEDGAVKGKAESESKSAARRILGYNELQPTQLSVSDQEFSAKSEINQQTTLPQYGRSDKINSFAKSLIFIKAQ